MNASGPSSKVRDIAQHLVAYEAMGRRKTDLPRPAALQVCEKLRPPLSTLTGAAGFHSLLVRALTLARREAPVLELVKVRDDGSLEGLTAGTTEPGGTLLIAQLISLLMTFIGDALTMRLLMDIWPNLRGVVLNSEGRE
jgi:hypothetical protein